MRFSPTKLKINKNSKPCVKYIIFLIKYFYGVKIERDI